MKNKRFWLGILVMALVFGMMVVGCEDDSTDDDEEVVDTTPSAPTGLTGTVDGNSVLLTWQAVANATVYSIENKKYYESSSSYQAIDDITSTNITFVELDSNTKYDFRIAAKNSKGEKSGWAYFETVETSNPKTGTVSIKSLETTHSVSGTLHNYHITVELELSNGSLWKWTSTEQTLLHTRLQSWTNLTPPSGFIFDNTSVGYTDNKIIRVRYSNLLNSSELAAPNLTVAIDQTKLTEMKGYTNITNSLTLGSPSTASSTAWVNQ
jgi:hypothetical protein